jgi:TRAP-type C4-dicarboxylate transport system substrate-binding protein
MVESMRQAGANGVALGVPEVYPGLQTGMIDTVVASALTLIALQWHARVRTMTQQGTGAVVGALVFRKDKFDALPERARDYIIRSSRDSEGEMRNGARRLDEQAYQTLVRRLQVVDTDPYRREWLEVGRRTREALVGRLYTRDLLQRVEAICARYPRPQ